MNIAASNKYWQFERISETDSHISPTVGDSFQQSFKEKIFSDSLKILLMSNCRQCTSPIYGNQALKYELVSAAFSNVSKYKNNDIVGIKV